MRRSRRNHSTKNIGIDLLTLGIDTTNVRLAFIKVGSQRSELKTERQNDK